jgi:MFS family permease
MSIAWPFFPLYIGALGGSVTEIGLVYALGGLAGLILYPVGGYIADHKGRVRLVANATYLFALHLFSL